MQRCLRLCRAASIQHTTAHRSELPTARRQRHALMSHVLRSLDTDASRLRVYVHALQKRALAGVCESHGACSSERAQLLRPLPQGTAGIGVL